MEARLFQRIVTTVVLVLASGAVRADNQAVTPTPTATPINIRALVAPRANCASPPGCTYGTGFEPEEGFAPGWLDGQSCWLTFTSSAAQASVGSVAPLLGTQHLTIAVDPNVPPGTLTGAFSPVFDPLPPNTSAQASVHVQISQMAPAGGADYFVLLQSNSQGFQTARIRFQASGDISVFDNLGDGNLVDVDTGFDWVPGEYRRLTIQVLPDLDEIRYHYGGQLVYQSSVLGGTNVERAVIFSDNLQNGDVGYFDNFVFGNVGPRLSINSPEACWNRSTVVDDQITLTIDMSCMIDFIAGGQFFLEYDNTVLDFESIEPGSAPYTRELFEAVDEGVGTIDYAVGVEDGNFGTTDDSTLAVLTFNVLQDACPQTGLVSFRTNAPPSRLSSFFADSVAMELADLGEMGVDLTSPDISCPADLVVNADAGTCLAQLTLEAATATDDCGVESIEGVRSDLQPLGDPFPLGTTIVTWTATDACGNIQSCDRFVTVEPFNELVADVELAPNIVTAAGDTDLVRCITFTVLDSGCQVLDVVKKEVTFATSDDPLVPQPAIGTASILVDCTAGELASCLVARDELHTLSSTDDDDFAIVGHQFVADFTGNDALVGGNLNGDEYIDILDFGGIVGQFSVNVGANTTCADTPIHADFSGDGVVTTGDLTFVLVNFLAIDEVDCCGPPSPRTGEDGPRSSISVAELRRHRLGHLAAADLNQDGMIDAHDIVAFLNGARPFDDLSSTGVPPRPRP